MVWWRSQPWKNIFMLATPARACTHTHMLSHTRPPSHLPELLCEKHFKLSKHSWYSRNQNWTEQNKIQQTDELYCKNLNWDLYFRGHYQYWNSNIYASQLLGLKKTPPNQYARDVKHNQIKLSEGYLAMFHQFQGQRQSSSLYFKWPSSKKICRILNSAALHQSTVILAPWMGHSIRLWLIILGSEMHFP